MTRFCRWDNMRALTAALFISLSCFSLASFPIVRRRRSDGTRYYRELRKFAGKTRVKFKGNEQVLLQRCCASEERRQGPPVGRREQARRRSWRCCCGSASRTPADRPSVTNRPTPRRTRRKQQQSSYWTFAQVSEEASSPNSFCALCDITKVQSLPGWTFYRPSDNPRWVSSPREVIQRLITRCFLLITSYQPLSAFIQTR